MSWHSHTMQALANRGEPAPASNEVWYWASEQVTLYSQTGVVSHTFADGMGKIRYNAPVTTMPNTLQRTSITAVVLPVETTSIANYAFYNCTTLKDVTLQNEVVEIGQYALSATAITAIQLPSRLTTIANNAFRAAGALASLVFPALVETIGNLSFYQCLSLAQIDFLGTPTSIASNAFRDCSSLTTIRVPWSLGAVAGAPWGATSATIIYDYTPS